MNNCYMVDQKIMPCSVSRTVYVTTELDVDYIGMLFIQLLPGLYCSICYGRKIIYLFIYQISS